MTEIREVVSRYSMPRRQFEERFPEMEIHPLSGLEAVEVEDVYRTAAPGEEATAVFIDATAPDGATWVENLAKHPLVLRGTRLRSGRWLTQNPTPQTSSDAEHQAPGT